MASGGQIGISVFPNLRGFHEDIRAAVRKADKNNKVNVPVDVKVDRVELDKLERDLKSLDNRSVLIRADVRMDEREFDAFMGRDLRTEVMVGVNTSPARRALTVLQEDISKTPLELSAVIKIDDAELEKTEREINSKELRVDGHLDLSTFAAELQMQEFKSRHNTFVTHLLVDTHRADEDMHGFRAKQAMIPVTQRIVYATSSIPEAPTQQLPNLNIPNSPWKGVEEEGWNVINMWGKTWKLMNDQLDAGIIDIYDDYRKFGVWLGQTLAKPVKNFNKMWQDSTSAKGFADSLSRSIGRMNDKIINFGLTAGSKLENLRISSGKVWDKFAPATKKTLSRVSRSFKAMSDQVSNFARSSARTVTDFSKNAADKAMAPFRKVSRFFRVEVGGAIASWGHVFRKMGGEAAAAAGKVAAPFRSMARFFRVEVGGAISSWGGVFRKMATEASVSAQMMTAPLVSFADGKIGKMFKNMAGQIGLNMRVVGLNIRDGFAKAFSPVTKMARKATEGVNSATSFMSRHFTVAGTKMASAFDGVRAKISGLSAPLGKAGESMKRWGNTMTRGVTRTASQIGAKGSRAFSAVGSRLGGLMANAAADPKAWAVFQKLMNTIGKYARGFSKIAIGAFAKVSGVIMSSLVPALQMAGIGILLLAGHAAIGAVVTLGAAIASAAQGALLLAPALVAAAGVSFAVLKVGLEGVGDAVGQAFSLETVEEFEEAMSELPNSVAEVARAFRTIKPAYDEMKRAVQDNLLEGLRPGIEQALGNLFPSISEGMQGLASEWNKSLKAALDELGSDRAGAGMANIMENIVKMGEEMQPVLANLLTAFGSLADQGSNWLPQLGEWLSDITDSFAQWAEGLREINEETGKSKFDTKMQNAVDAAKNLGAILGGVFGLMRNIFQAAGEGGTGMMSGMVEGAQAMNEATKEGTENYEKMVDFFRQAGEAASMVGEVLDPVLGIVIDIAGTLAGLATGIIPGLTSALGGVEDAMAPIREAAEGIGEDLGEGLGALAPALAGLGDVIAPLLQGIGSGLGEVLVAIGPSLATIVEAMAPVAEAFIPMFEAAGGAIGEIFVALEPVITSGLSILEKMAPVLTNIFEWFGVLGGAIVEALSPLFVGHDQSMGRLLDAISPVVDALGGGLLRVIELLAPYIPIIAEAFDLVVLAIAALLPYLPPLIDFFLDVLTPLADMLLPIAAIIGGIFLAVKLGTGIMGALTVAFEVARGAVMLARGAVMLFNLALKANPIGMIVTLIGVLVGALIYFFTQTETGKALWASFTEFLGNAWNGLMEGIQWAWENILQPVWEAIKTAAAVLFAVVMTVLITPFILAWNLLSWAIQGAWNNIIKPVVDAFAAGWNWLAGMIGVGWILIQGYWNAMVHAIRVLWATHVQPILDSIGRAWSFMTDIFQAGWDRIRGMWDAMAAALRALWAKHVQPVLDNIGRAWTGMKDGMVNVWNNIKSSVFDAFGGVLDWFRDKFAETVERVGNLWNGLKDLMAKPINFVIEQVFNRGIRRAWNAVADLVGLGTIDDVALIGDGRGKDNSFATGGVLPGYSPGYDDHHFYSRTAGNLHLSGGEAIMRPEWTRAVGGPKAVEAMNNDAKRGKLASRPKPRAHSDGGVVDRFASGGIVQSGARITTDIQRSMWDAVRTAFPTAQLSSGTRNWGTTSYHDRGMAIDLGGGWASDLQGIANWIASGYPHAAELFWDPGPNIKNGQPTGAIGGHSDHVHWAMTNMVDPYTGEVVDGGGGGGGVWQAITNTVKRLWDGVMDLIPSFGGADTMGSMGQVPGAWLKTQASAAWDYIKGLADNIREWVGGGGPGADWDPGAGAEQWRSGVIAAFQRQGEVPQDHLVDALVRQIWTESKGDPNIAQQIVDSNGTGASAGLGLYQFIPGTFAGYRDPSLPNDRTNPEAAHNAAVRYFRDRHGWNTGPGGVGRGHGWKDGGIFDPSLTAKFDLGGLARGKGLLNKEIVQPERVLSPHQTRAFESFVFGFMPELIKSYKNRPFNINQAVNELIDGWNGIQKNANKDRRRQIEGLAGDLQKTFADQADGGRVTGTELDMASLMQRFEGRQMTSVTADSLLADGRFLEGWYRNNEANLKRNVDSAVRDSISVGADPTAYLEAEKLAKERIDEAEEAKKKEEDEKRQEEEEARREEERKKRDEERNALLEGLTEEQKELKQAEFDREDEERKAAEDAEKARKDELARAEQERIKEAKASGEYYYGYKALADDGTNPNEYEDSAQVAEAKRYAAEGADFAGVTDAYNGVMDRAQVLLSLGSGIETAIPAWQAALNGDRSGLNHNIAAAHAANQERTLEEAQNLGPSALFGVIEMVASATGDKGPFIGTVQSGMTPGQLNSTLTYYESQRSRRRGGTPRTR